MEKTEDGSKQPFNLGGLRANDMKETLIYATCFMHQYDANNEKGE